MKIDLEKLKEPLKITEIDFRVQSVSAKGYITVLAYKDARADMNRLDEAVGVLNWKREHTRENHNCIVSIWDENKKQWISKEDTGAESFTEKEKGLASDSFKRACFNFGIGRELYDYPFIFFQLFPNEFSVVNGKAKTTFDFNLKKWTWKVEHTDKGIHLMGKDNNGRLRFDSNKDFNGIPKENTPTPPAPKQAPKTTLVKDSKDWKDLEGFIKEGKLTNVSQITKFTVTPELAKDLEALITARIDEGGRLPALTKEQFEQAKTMTKTEVLKLLAEHRMAGETRSALEKMAAKLK